MTSACNLHINNLNSVNIIKLRRHLGVQTGLTACTEQSLLGSESVELYVFIFTNTYVHSDKNCLTYGKPTRRSLLVVSRNAVVRRRLVPTLKDRKFVLSVACVLSLNVM